MNPRIHPRKTLSARGVEHATLAHNCHITISFGSQHIVNQLRLTTVTSQVASAHNWRTQIYASERTYLQFRFTTEPQIRQTLQDTRFGSQLPHHIELRLTSHHSQPRLMSLLNQLGSRLAHTNLCQWKDLLTFSDHNRHNCRRTRPRHHASQWSFNQLRTQKWERFVKSKQPYRTVSFVSDKQLDHAYEI
ncbi:Hypothetical protein, putative [Bodo saltans]|uniref:Uncharacterized protein n=1 Tax=Bodo saltans TaxID=75058 RepID=A0A0S4J1Y5_BODSA|nr:Hypothetical protein, putative [Bodo saltans]|eukprot:CUG83757.1 Hypothetical protein, putative [Bodo saltans]